MNNIFDRGPVRFGGQEIWATTAGIFCMPLLWPSIVVVLPEKVKENINCVKSRRRALVWHYKWVLEPKA